MTLFVACRKNSSPLQNSFWQIHRTERDETLQRLILLLKADQRIGAAWLTGSLGRGDADDLSDIDLWMAVDDAACATIVAGRRDYVAQLAQPLLIVEAPQNAPHGGGYLLVMYAGAAGPQYVDWLWCPQSTAYIPLDAQVLFNRSGIPMSPSPAPLSRHDRAKQGTNHLNFFWAMVPVVAKKIARRQPWAALALLSMLQRTLDDLRFLATPDVLVAPRSFEDRRSQEPPRHPNEQLTALNELMAEVTDLTPRLRELGCHPPAEALSSIHDVLEHSASLN